MNSPSQEETVQQKVSTTNSISQPLIPNQAPHRKNKIVLFIIFSFVLIILLLFVPIPYYQSQNAQCKVGAANCPTKGWHLGLSLWQSLNPNYTSGHPAEQSYIATPSPTPINVDETADWKTYANTKYSFTFKYPITWQIEEVKGNSLRIIHRDGPTDIRNYEVVSWYVNYQDLQNAKVFIYDSRLQKWGHLAWEDPYNSTGSGKFTEINQLFTTKTGNPVYCLGNEGGANQLIPLSTKLFIVMGMGKQRCIQDSNYPPPEDKIYKVIQSFNLTSS